MHSKQFIQTTFFAHNWTHGEKGVRSRSHFSDELVRELSREPNWMGTSLSLVVDLLHYSFPHLCSFFCWFLKKRIKKSSLFPLQSLVLVVLSFMPQLIGDLRSPQSPECSIPAMSNTCKMPSILGIPKHYYEHRAKSDHSVKSAREGAYQKECSHCGDLVQFHQQSECFLVVATVLLVHKEFVFLQGETK